MTDKIRDQLWADTYAAEKAANRFARNPAHEADMAVKAYDARLHAQVAALTATPAQPAAHLGGAYAELPDGSGNPNLYADPPTKHLAHGGARFYNLHQLRDFADRTYALRTSNRQAPAGAANTKTHELLSTMIGLFLRAKEKIGYQPGSAIDKTVAEAVEHLKDWPYPETPTAQTAPAAGITVEQVEDAIGLQSTAWDTIGAEKIVEAVLRLANAKAPAAGAVAGMPPGISALMCVISSLRDTAHFSDEEGELTDELRTLRDWAMTQAAATTPAAQADSQPAPVAAFEVADAMADSQYLAGVSAGWNAANADDPNAALQKLHESRAGYLKPLSAARDPADSVLEDAARLLRQILAASQDGDSDTHLSAHFVSRIETITKPGGAA